MDIEQTAVIIRDAIRDIPKRYGDNLQEIKRLEQEQEDLLHLVELQKFNAYQGYKISEQLQTVRIRRRELKDENDQLKHMKTLLSDMKSKVKQLDTAIGQIRKEKTRLVERKYRCRSRKDLENIINGVKK